VWKAVKFVFVCYVGPSVGGMAKGRVGAHKGDVKALIGQSHVDIQTDDMDDLSEAAITAKLKKASGANYDLGSNAGGTYKSQAGGIQASARANYQSLEKQSNIGPIGFNTKSHVVAKTNVTTMDLGGRPMVAPPTEAKKNVVVRDETSRPKAAATSGVATTDMAKLKEVEAKMATGGARPSLPPAEPVQPPPAPPALSLEPSTGPGTASHADKLRRGTSQIVDASETPKPRLSRFETLEQTFDGADREKERPPSARGAALKAPRTRDPPPMETEVLPAQSTPPVPVPVPVPVQVAPPVPVPPAVTGYDSAAAGPLGAFSDRVVVLYTSMTRDQLATVATRKIITQLEGMGVPFAQLDGTQPEHKETRGALWALAGVKPGTYPIVYVGASGFVCHGDDVQDLIDSGQMEAKLRAGSADAKATPEDAPPVPLPPTTPPQTAPPPPAVARAGSASEQVFMPPDSPALDGLRQVGVRLHRIGQVDTDAPPAATCIHTSQFEVLDLLEELVKHIEDGAAHAMLAGLASVTNRLERVAAAHGGSASASPAAAQAPPRGDLAAMTNEMERLVVRLEKVATA